MVTQARKIFNLNDSDNTTLTKENLEKVAVQRDQNWEKGETAYIFNDGSAIIDCGSTDFRVEQNYGLSKSYEQL